MSRSDKFVLWYDEIDNNDVSIVGGKNASLGEMYSILTKKGINVPYGFAVTAESYRYFIKYNGIDSKIVNIISGLRKATKKKNYNIGSLQSAGKNIRNLILRSKFPKDLEQDIIRHYILLSKFYKSNNIDVAVRSSATAEDLPTASFAGQLESYLNIKGHKTLLHIIKRCFASLFTDRAISYRLDKGFHSHDIAISVGVIKMVRSDKACSGVMFSIDTETGFKNSILINGSYGLGENIVKGRVNPDEFIVFKPNLENKKFIPILKKTKGNKLIKMIYTKTGTKNIKTTLKEQKNYCLTDEEILMLARWAKIIEDHYSTRNKRYSPMDMEWAKDGKTNKIFMVQARPETIHSREDVNIVEHYLLNQKGKIITSGDAVGTKIGKGIANVILHPKDIHKFKKGQVLVTDMTDPDWEPIMKIASAIVTDKGGRTSHAAIISRELGIPAIVGTNNASKVIKSGQKLTVSCSEGDEGYVYLGLLDYNVEKIKIKGLKMPTNTDILMNLGNPDKAFSFASLPNKGIGLAREEFIISSHIKIHPNALINYNHLDTKTKKQIDDIVHQKDRKQYYVDKLAEGIAMIAASVYPDQAIIRFSDFKSNEYAKLIGGSFFEPTEENPMLGYRGASRYYSNEFKKAFMLECKAIQKVRDNIGLDNIKVMVPFCRTTNEAKKVLDIIKDTKLISSIYADKRKKNELEIYVMAELPSNILSGEEFAIYFDGFSIGTNDLTQLTLGIDRDSELVAQEYDENNLAVKKLVADIIKIAHKNRKKIGICGDAPSTKPEFAKFLIDNKIDSISLSPDAIVRITQYLQKKKTRKKIKRKNK